MLNEAISKLDFERREKGLPPFNPPRVVIQSPAKPVMDNEIKLTDIPSGWDVELEHAKKNTLKNAEGVRFIGFDVTINLNPVAKKRGPGRPKESEELPPEPKTLKGWMFEGEFLGFVRLFRKQIDYQIIQW